MKSIRTLVRDIQDRLTNPEPFEADDVAAFSDGLSKRLAERLAERAGRPSLRLSNLGTPCARKLWYSVNRPEQAEPLGPSARLKFLFGDILEEVILFLARAAGHRVEDEQQEVEVNGVRGHIDATVDGELVDVKSASSYSFKKFAEHRLEEDDPFGYLTQLGSYATAKGKKQGHFLAVDKQLGHIALDTHEAKDEGLYTALVDARRDMLASDTPPARGYRDVADGKSGNRKLDIGCSYCAFKATCWPGLRAFGYARGPVFLTHVARVPDVPEIPVGENE